MNFKILPLLKFKNYSPEWVDQEDIVLSRSGELLFYKDLDKKPYKKIRIGGIVLHYMCLCFPVLSRLFRFQFYNLVKVSANSWYIFFDKDIYYLVENNLQKVKISKTFRVFRGGVAKVGSALYFGEYKNNKNREPINVYKLEGGEAVVIYTFPSKAIRHVHSVSYNNFDNCLYVLTGDFGDEAKILKCSLSVDEVDLIASGTEDYRAIVIHFSEGGFIYATDAQYQKNLLMSYNADLEEKFKILQELDGPVFYSLRLEHGFIFSTAFEGAAAQRGKNAELFYFSDGLSSAQKISNYEKDALSTKYFQFGYFRFPGTDYKQGRRFFTPVGLKAFPGLHEIIFNEV